jgi:hypothetical protein
MATLPTATLPATDQGIDQRVHAQVECILHSETLRSSEVLRRLLRFLADKTLSGEADGLKEYTVAIDALQKPPTYDPKHESTVRIQVSRLRNKLGEYYRGEGKDDPVIVELPKGRFKLTFEVRQESPQISLPVQEKTRVEPMLIWLAVVMWLTLLIAIAWGEYYSLKLRRNEAINLPVGALHGLDPSWTPEIQALWGPFVSNGRPAILGVEDPLFMELQQGDGIYYRDKSLNEWGKLASTPGATGLRKLLKNPEAQPSRYYSTVGEVYTAFMIGKLLGAREQNLSLVRTSELSWQEIADNNILFIGKQVFFDAQLREMPIRPQLIAVPNGIENLNPSPGEPRLFPDRYSTAPTEQGEVYALITHLPGPLGNSDVESFTSNRGPGYVAAVQWFTDPVSARALVAKLRKSSGELPKYYQVVLKVKFKDEVPTETSYVLSRELR